MVMLAAVLGGLGYAQIPVDDQTTLVGGIMALINIVLRFKTSKGVTATA